MEVWLLAFLAASLFGVASGEASPDGDSRQGGGPPVEEAFEIELVYPQQAGELQLTLAPRFAAGDDADETRLPLTVEYGLSDTWQVELSLDAWVRVEPEDAPRADGVGDLELEIKRAFMDVRKDLHLALGFGVTYPLGDVDEDLSEGFAEYEVALLFGREFSVGRSPGSQGRPVLFGQLGVAFVDRVESPDEPPEEGRPEGEPAAHEIEAGLGLLLPFRRFTASFELSGSDNTWNRDGDERELYLTAGLILPLAGDWEAGFGTGFGLVDDSDDLRLTAMLTGEF